MFSPSSSPRAEVTATSRGIVRRVNLRWLRILDVGTDPADDPDLVLRKRTAVATLLAVLVIGIVYAVLGWTSSRPLVLVFALLQIAAELLNLAVFSRTRRLQPFVWAIIGIGIATIFSGVVTLGGLALSAGNIVWAILAPMGAILLISGRAGHAPGMSPPGSEAS